MPVQNMTSLEPNQGLEPNPLMETQGRYTKIQTLGKGSFGFVQLARNWNQEMVAIKFLKRGDVNKYVEAEIVNHSLLRHPHVIQFKDVFLTSEYICIAMEYATGGSLFSYVQVRQALLVGLGVAVTHALLAWNERALRVRQLCCGRQVQKPRARILGQLMAASRHAAR